MLITANVLSRDGKTRLYVCDVGITGFYRKTKQNTYVLSADPEYRGFVVLRYVDADGVHILAEHRYQPVSIVTKEWRWSVCDD